MEEKELVQQSKEGNEEAFASLVKKYKTKIFNLAWSLTRDRETADDLEAYIALPKFQFKSGFGTWLYRITVNHVNDYLRKKSKMSKMLFEKMKETTHFQEDEMKKIEKEQIGEQRKIFVRECLKTMPEKYQVIISLRDIQGFTYEEITKILKISPGTVDSRLHRARKMLRQKLAPFFSQKGGNHEM
jgi:RNA polymerase sigma-70 factor (ECF subfamily)